MKDLVIDVLAVYGAYRIGKYIWDKNKDRVSEAVINVLKDHLDSVISEYTDDEIKINLNLGGRGK